MLDQACDDPQQEVVLGLLLNEELFGFEPECHGVAEGLDGDGHWLPPTRVVTSPGVRRVLAIRNARRCSGRTAPASLGHLLAKQVALDGLFRYEPAVLVERLALAIAHEDIGIDGQPRVTTHDG